jgi:hypothetical protein
MSMTTHQEVSLPVDVIKILEDFVSRVGPVTLWSGKGCYPGRAVSMPIPNGLRPAAEMLSRSAFIENLGK